MNLTDGFDVADAAMLGSVIGLIEEAEENEGFGENGQITRDNVKEENIEDSGLRLLYNENPDLVIYLINRFLERKKMAVANREFKLVMEEMREEVRQVKRETNQNKKEEER